MVQCYCVFSAKNNSRRRVIIQDSNKTMEIKMWYKPQRSLKPSSQDADELLILDVGPNIRAADQKFVNCYRLNKTAAEIWGLCDGKHDVNSLVSIISTKYGIDAKEVKVDVIELLSELARQGFLEVNHEPFF